MNENNHDSEKADSAQSTREKLRSRLRSGASGFHRKAHAFGSHCAAHLGKTAENLTSHCNICVEAVSQVEILEFAQHLTSKAASIYDKALDAEYIRTHIGGGNHRLFDHGHDLVNAWKRAKQAASDDSFSQEILGYASALWKDGITVKGLPFVTLDPDTYNAWADRLSRFIPELDRKYFYDLLSHDVGEILGAGLGAVSTLLCLSKGDQRRLAELLGSLGVNATTAANPILGLLVLATVAYSFGAKREQFDHGSFAKGCSKSFFSWAIFALLGFPFFVKLLILMVVIRLSKKRLFGQEELLVVIRRWISEALVQWGLYTAELLERARQFIREVMSRAGASSAPEMFD